MIKPQINPADIQHWVFDLDNTLYHHSFNLFQQVEKLMTKFIMEKWNMDINSAKHLQKKYFIKYGTTLRGLMENDNIDPIEFLNKIHEIDYSLLPRNDKLASDLQNISGQKYIFTNANQNHTIAILNQLGIKQTIFAKMIFIEDIDYIPKPNIPAYEKFFSHCQQIQKQNSVLIDDIADNLKTAKHFGMKTVWLKNTSYPHNPAPHPLPDYIDMAIDNIDDFVADMIR
ncbi:MAG: pyrimidine 5'-nucleotidase [Alphaproteobacteria bacterium]